ncbi:exonuclease SbcCD subunit D [Paenibacillus herberti]|uniref:Nuclease SbcCD subunit D n=1 Tax=Paenibacillus herberti TaxID=1619309 RepID=A0A229P038_9BACL|nr:exonuclease SbcCD subunit D [Paenibacillus herberti]OXM15602.1 exonuclease sbcCD subunit D [Paenibacillus herberti]
MKFIHTADWHLGKLVQGVYMTEDQRYVLEQLLDVIEKERPDAVIIAGDLYDRAVPPTEAVELLDEMFSRIVIGLGTPVIAVSGNHDSPDRINFGTRLMAGRGLHLAGQLRLDAQPVSLQDEFGEVHFHLVPYCDPSTVRLALQDESIRTHDAAMKAVTERLAERLDPKARHVFVGHAFVTPGGEPQDNTSDSERPLSIGGAEYVKPDYFKSFHYTAMGHLHQAHWVGSENIRYSGSLLKYSISEEHHRKGYLMVELDGEGKVSVEHRLLAPRRDMRRVSGYIRDIEASREISEDYVFVTLLDENPVLFPMEKIRTVFPNALHVERRPAVALPRTGLDGEKGSAEAGGSRRDSDPVSLFEAFYREVKEMELSESKKRLFHEVCRNVLQGEGAAR